MTIESVCFDLDDTLFEYHRYALAGLESAADHLADRTGTRYHEALVGIYFDDGITEGTFDELAERHDLPPEIVDELIEAYHSATSLLEPYPETKPVLSRLEDEYQLGLITDGRQGHAKLQRLGIRTYFETVLVTPTIGRSKHDPIVFERVLSDLSLPPEAVVYVGDDPRVDFRVPNKFGMTTVRLRQGRYIDLDPPDETAAPDHEIRQLDELLGLVDVNEHDEIPDRVSQTDLR